jgi:hypothetical protein
MRFSVESNLNELTKRLTRIQKEQVPFATSMALNNVAADVANAITAQMDRYLDNPTPFTKRAYQSRPGTFRTESGARATKKKLFVDIIPGKVQAEYLKFQIEGGVRTPNQRAIFVPSRVAPKNKFGNLTRGNRKRFIAGQGQYFSAGDREDKTPGVYKRESSGKIQPMAFYVERANYKAIFPIDKIAGGVVKNRFGLRFDQALKRALATAR